MNTKEIEIKIKLNDAEAVIGKALSLGAKFLPEESGFEKDVMYEKEGGNFFHEHKTLRLRQTPFGNLLTYKEKLPEGKHKFLLQRLEIQTKFEDYEAMDKILGKLGYFPYKIKEKESAHYLLDGLKLEFHKMPFLGNFLEIEGEEERLKDVLKKLGLNFEQGINKDYSGLFFIFCDEHGIDKSTPQTFEEEKKYLSLMDNKN